MVIVINVKIELCPQVFRETNDDIIWVLDVNLISPMLDNYSCIIATTYVGSIFIQYEFFKY
jgi:hypothetical protein